MDWNKYKVFQCTKLKRKVNKHMNFEIEYGAMFGGGKLDIVVNLLAKVY